MTALFSVRQIVPCVLGLSMLAAAPAHAAPPPLDAAALHVCASQVGQLRSEAARLLANGARLDARRSALDQRSAALQAEAAGLDRSDLRATLDLQQRRQQHNDELQAFNADIARHRQAIDAINRVKQTYARDCADRAYRRADFRRLPAEEQAAMRAGLDDIEVPYLDPAANP
ncbi:hypothetical protein [Solimonas terrae]|uniref:Uncharacterized protein n=1 Tax=Solimonas terrae TaxID=1396819 RepID=A0A6M2BRT4_9GAMM|nr:hypothetical protein [Solimonas terrae]NGY04965.1 hypothetical protein [Solimonas terrae]